MCYIYKDNQKSAYIQNIYWVYADYIRQLSYERTFSVPSESTIPYFFQENSQNDKYYYAQLIFGFSPLVGHYNIFYRKSDDKSFFFRETTEGVMLKTVYFCDDFLLSLASYEDMEAYKHVLDEQEFAKLKGRTEEDNPFLVKCYFK